MHKDVKSTLGFVGAIALIVAVISLTSIYSQAISGAATTAGEWTAWYDDDTPMGSGDFETIGNLQQLHPGEICDAPAAVECRTTTGRTIEDAGEVVTCGANIGFMCKNTQQLDEHCIDYEVRFYCESAE